MIVFWLAGPQSLLVTTKQFCPSTMTSWSLALVPLSRLQVVLDEACRRLLSACIVRYRFLASVTGWRGRSPLPRSFYPLFCFEGRLFQMWQTTWFLLVEVKLHSWMVSQEHIVTIFSCTSAQFFQHKEYVLRKEWHPLAGQYMPLSSIKVSDPHLRWPSLVLIQKCPKYSFNCKIFCLKWVNIQLFQSK